MAKLEENPTLNNLQNYVRNVGKERGWDKNTYLETFLLFIEETGEIAKAIRNYSGLYSKKATNKEELKGEFADVLHYFLELVNHFDIDLEDAFRQKEKINESRKWD